MSGVSVEIRPVTGKTRDSFLRHDITDEQGFFGFEQIIDGQYLIVVNHEGVVSSREPFPTVYYPDVFEREKAKIINVTEGEDQRDIRIRVPKVSETITLTGLLRSADGIPVVSGAVVFRTVQTDKRINGTAMTRTDTEGNFTIRILKGFEGELSGSAVIDRSNFRACPDILKLINDSRKDFWDGERSNVVRMVAERNLGDIELKLAIPSCNKAKINSLIRVD